MNIQSLFSLNGIIPSQELSKAANRILQFQDDKKKMGQALILESHKLTLKYKQKFLQKYETKLNVLLDKVKSILKQRNVKFVDTEEEEDEDTRAKEICDLTLENIVCAILDSMCANTIIRMILRLSDVPLYASTVVFKSLSTTFETLCFYQHHVACLLIISDISKAFDYNMSLSGIIGKILHGVSVTMLGLYKKGYISRTTLQTILPIIRGAASAAGQISTAIRLRDITKRTGINL